MIFLCGKSVPNDNVSFINHFIHGKENLRYIVKRLFSQADSFTTTKRVIPNTKVVDEKFNFYW